MSYLLYSIGSIVSLRLGPYMIRVVLVVLVSVGKEGKVYVEE